MKKQLLAVAALALTLQLANAQTEQGKQNIGLNLGFTTFSNNNNAVPTPPTGGVQNSTNKYTNLNIGPDYSYFIANNLDLGVALSYSHQKQDDTNLGYGSSQTNDGYGANIYLRKYVLYNNKFGFRTGGRFGYTHNNSKYNYNSGGSVLTNTETKTNQYYGGLLFDLVYYPTTKLGFAATLANATYNHSNSDSGTNGTGSSNAFNFNFINSGLGLSVFYAFGGK